MKKSDISYLVEIRYTTPWFDGYVPYIGEFFDCCDSSNPSPVEFDSYDKALCTMNELHENEDWRIIKKVTNFEVLKINHAS